MNSKKHPSLAAFLSLLGIVPVIVCSVFLCVAAMALVGRIVQTDVRQQVELSLGSLDGEITAVFTPYAERLDTFAIAASNGLGRDELNDLLFGYSAALGEGSSCYYATAISRYEEGGYYLDDTGWEPEADWIPTTRDWWKDAVRENGRVAFSEPYIDAQTGALCVTLSRAVYAQAGGLLGVAAIDIYLNTLADIVDAIRVSESGATYLVDAKGLYLTNGDGAKRLVQSYLSDTPELSAHYSAKTYLDGTTKAFTIKNRYYGVRRVAALPWFIVAEGEQRDFTRGISSSVALLLAVLAVMVVLFAAAEIVSMRRTSRVFKRLADGCAVIARGDFTQSYDDSFTAEASLLAQGFNTFSETLRQLIGAMKESKSALQAAGERLQAGTKDTATAIEGIITNIAETEGKLEKQNTSVEQTVSSVRTINENINSLETLIDAQTKAAQTAAGAVEQMISNISEVNASVDKMARSFGTLAQDAESGAKTQEELQQQIGEIETQSKLLSEANTVIANIASQTNLLAMNAAIEAAHAGEAGKGFAVVADEIRKLSETSSTQSKTIGDQLKRIQDTINTVVSATQRGVQGYAHLAGEISETDRLVQQIKAAMTEQQQGSAQITAALRGMNESTAQVQKASQEMTAGSRTIMSEVGTLQEETRAMKQGMDEMNRSAGKISETGSALAEISALMEKSIGEIGRQVDQFVV